MDRELTALKEKIRAERGFNSHHYKDRCLLRRLAVRMRARGEESFEGYARLLDRDPGEYELLLDALTINVTKFFRDYETWQAIGQEVVPRLFELSGPRRVWSAGCASGEEAYTVSILLHEWAEANGGAGEVASFQVLGTDIDRRSLEIARRAEYTDLSLVETPPPIRERWFAPGPPYRLDPAARRIVSFAQRDLISGPLEAGQSLILCRNVIIYLNREMQEELFQRFHDALVPGGFLVLGRVEALLGPARALFDPIDRRERIFRRRA